MSTEYLSRGTKYLVNDRIEKAISVLLRECKRKASKEAYLNLGVAYMLAGEFELARVWMDKIEAVPFYNGKKGEYIDAYLNRGLLEYAVGDDLSAIDIYRDGLEISKDFSLMWNYAHARLRQYCSGKYDNLAFCWQMYETRFKIPNAVVLSTKPNWTGGVHVDSITILAEQGIGDNIMFGRYLEEVSKWCNRLVVQCEKSANAIFSKYEVSNSLTIDTIHCIPMCSLGNLLDHIPNGKWIDGWNKERFGKLQIGCVWQSLNKHANARFRNCSVERMLSLADYGDLFSLGPDCIDSRITHLKSDDWKDTIEHLKNLDIVIAIDSSIANLCGSMGIPCLVLMPKYNTDFRWGDSSMGFSNKWYDSVKVIRNPGDWSKVFESVKVILECLK